MLMYLKMWQVFMSDTNWEIKRHSDLPMDLITRAKYGSMMLSRAAICAGHPLILATRKPCNT